MALVLLLQAPAATQTAERARAAAQAVHRRGGYADELRIGADHDRRAPRNAVVDADRGAPGEAGAAPTNANPDRAAADGRDYIFPDGRGTAPETKPPPPRRPAPDTERPRPTPPNSSPVAEALPPGLGRGLLWIVIALMVGGLVWVVVRSWRRPPAAESAPDRQSTVPSATESPVPLLELARGDPDALAADGRFGEAIGALLLRALEHAGWRPEGRGRSATAREVAFGLSDDDPRRQPLQVIVGLAEHVRFGGRQATAERYREIRTWFSRMAGGALR